MPTKKMPASFAALLVTCVILSACSDPEPAPQTRVEMEASATEHVTRNAQSTQARQPNVASHPVTEHLFRCTDGEEFSIRFGDQVATLNTSSEQFDLRQQPTGAGVRYADETVEFLSKGDQAIFMIADQTHDCTLVSSEQQQIPGPETTAAKP